MLNRRLTDQRVFPLTASVTPNFAFNLISHARLSFRFLPRPIFILGSARPRLRLRAPGGTFSLARGSFNFLGGGMKFSQYQPSGNVAFG